MATIGGGAAHDELNNGGPTITELAYREKASEGRMKRVLKEVMEEMLKDTTYEADKCNEIAKKMADTVRNRLKKIGSDRYKYIVQVIIGERRDQGLHYSSRCFWDANTDDKATETYTNDHIFCTATSYAMYLY